MRLSSRFLSSGLLALTVLSGSVYAPNEVVSTLFQRLRTLVPGILPLTVSGILGKSATYDYVVVGAGTAGTAIAVRLAQSGAKVALVEAGAYYEFTNPIVSSTPGLDILLIGSDPANSNPLVDWVFVAKDQPGANYRPIHFARGKCVGGSSALNFMIYQRPTVQSMQAWADEVDDHSYTFDQVLPYFEKSASITPPDMSKRFSNSTPKYNPSTFTDGPLQVSFANYAQSFSTWLKSGFEKIGIKEAEDFNSGSLMGAQYCTSTIRHEDQTRSSSEASYFQSALKAGLNTLKVYTTTRAEKILFDSNKKATGVQVKTGLLSYTLKASKEVIVSAGAFQSPQLLMVSGIGPRDQLEPLGIDVISELPGVGQNMWDHPTFGPTYPVDLTTLTREARDVPYLTEQLLKYTTKQEGSLTNPVSDFLAWEKIPQPLRSQFSPATQAKLAQFPADWPEVEYISGAGFVGDFSNFLLVQPFDGRNYATILDVLITPLSRGNVTITSSSTADLPIINPAWLTDPADQELAIAAYKRARQLFKEGLTDIVTGPEAFPGEEIKTDAQILSAIKDSLMTLWHPACTCKMGKDDDKMAVLDSKAKVRGVKGLRVVDASSFPILPPGHPQSTVYMLAEKIAESIINGR
ncbi:alcohol oxidase [Delitschia confertaspora ATCC 74209]|uniref:Alcohol oxidase n=1 Tax=Delitschia confertaspora ATCC 74209 TaxID=1513339 RepID=A0A9P4MT16_9PLEO|nr:alcohol oxidase [Delitschia confertaspora ATCC 74209]